jgi:hypothetical protein
VVGGPDSAKVLSVRAFLSFYYTLCEKPVENERMLLVAILVTPVFGTINPLDKQLDGVIFGGA